MKMNAQNTSRKRKRVGSIKQQKTSVDQQRKMPVSSQVDTARRDGDDARERLSRQRRATLLDFTYVVVVVDDDEVLELQVTGERRRLGGDALLEAPVAAEGPHAMVDELRTQ